MVAAPVASERFMTAYLSDTGIADEILKALSTVVPGRQISVLVHDGRVTLRGVVAEAATRRTIKDLVGDVEGVSAITDLITLQAPVLAGNKQAPAPVTAPRRTGKRAAPGN